MRTSIIWLFSTFPSTRFWKQFYSFFFLIQKEKKKQISYFHRFFKNKIKKKI